MCQAEKEWGIKAFSKDIQASSFLTVFRNGEYSGVAGILGYPGAITFHFQAGFERPRMPCLLLKLCPIGRGKY